MVISGFVFIGQLPTDSGQSGVIFYFLLGLMMPILLHVLRPKSELFKKSNCYNGPILWNTSPTYIRSLKEID